MYSLYTTGLLAILSCSRPWQQRNQRTTQSDHKQTAPKPNNCSLELQLSQMAWGGFGDTNII